MKRLLASIGLCSFLFSLTGIASAQGTSVSSAAPTLTGQAEACGKDINKAMNKEKFIYEGMLFGVSEAEAEEQGATRVDRSGNTWIKVSDGVWANGNEFGNNDDMDANTAQDLLGNIPAIHLGIMETQKANTSDLLPPLLQSFRAFQCRIESICGLVEQSISKKKSQTDPVKVHLPGCKEITFEPLLSCQLAAEDAPGKTAAYPTISDEAFIRSYCSPVAQKMIDYHESQLSYLAHYDAAHRSIRQLAGYLDPLIDALSFPLLTPLRQIATFFSNWSRVPCFLSYCANPQ